MRGKTPSDGKANMPAHLIDDHGAKRCSVCKTPFPSDALPSLSKAFAYHVLKTHMSESNENSNKRTR